MSDAPSTPRSPELSWREDGQPVSAEFDDPYFSVENGLQESRYVFLQHNGLPHRWQQWQGSFCIVETGFGTGLNFLMSWQSWRQHQNTGDARRWLHMTSIEKYPMDRGQLQQALALWPELQELSQRLLEQYPLAVAGFHHLSWPEERISLTLVFDDVSHALPQLSGPVHAWYLDGFAPSKNPQMWSDELFAGMRRLSNLSQSTSAAAETADQLTSVATFTAAGRVRRGLSGAGFHVTRVPGFGRKREMLAGFYNRRCGPEPHILSQYKPWQLAPAAQPSERSHGLNKDDRHIAVIGAGLAGTTTARMLASRGYRVTLLDHQGIAQGGSGNPQGGLYVKLAANDQAIHTDFYLQAFQYALNFMQAELGPGDSHNPHWQQCGVLQLAYDEKEARRQDKFCQTGSVPADLVYPVSPSQASDLCGTPQTTGGLFFPSAGWVSPAALCQQLIQHHGIEFVQHKVQALHTNEDGWTLITDNGTLNADQVVICTAADARDLLPDAYLPVKTIRGQLSYLDPLQAPALNTVVCGRSYMAPPRNGRLCLGATYNLKDNEYALRDSDHQTNLSHLPDFGPEWQAFSARQDQQQAVLGGRVGFRCTTPDYLPMTGPVPRSRDFVARFAPMVRNAKRIPAQPVPCYPGLWLNIGHGSRGLASGPLCAALLTAQISGDALPVGLDVAGALWPGRFLLRDMIRRKLPDGLYPSG